MTARAHKAQLTRLRRSIDAIDAELVRLLTERHGLARDVAELKRHSGRERYIPVREKQILARVNDLNGGRLPAEALAGIFRDILGLCRQTERPLVVAFPGPQGSLSHAAAREQFGASTELLATAGLAEVFEAVAQQRADYGIVPLETSSEGIGVHALEYFLESDLTITAEYYWKLKLAVAGNRIRGRPRRLIVQEMIFALNRPWISESFRAAEIVLAPSVAWSAREASEHPGSAAICPHFSASVHGLDIVSEAPGAALAKEMRFLTVGRSMPVLTRADKTTVAFSLIDRVGVLDDALRIFRRRKVNLSLLDSYYPSKTIPTVTFFADFHGHATERAIARVLQELRGLSSFVKVLGSYPVFGGLRA
ncbi:MAG: chorismate mutase [Candidatus Wallbacteria bacterium]|nr:chorismate mutase [Candidatus Wallbacteria bacterium]